MPNHTAIDCPDALGVRVSKLRLEPGDTLVIQVPSDWVADHIRAFAGNMQLVVEMKYPAVKVLMVPSPARVLKAGAEFEPLSASHELR